MSGTVLHFSDLHLTAGPDRAYSLEVLEEIVSIAQDGSTRAVVIAGDLFDSFADVEALRADVRQAFGGLTAPVFFLPGNHEALRAGVQDLSRFDLSPLRPLAGKPFELVTLEGDPGYGPALEILAVPHQLEYGDFRQWNVPEKRTPFRLGVAHAVVTGLDLWFDQIGTEEEAVAALDPECFVRNQVDYVALGHIHNAPEAKTIEGTTLRYGGSARVWRRGEAGPRRVWRLDLSTGESTGIELSSAGRYHFVEVPLDLDGAPPDLASVARGWSPRDMVELSLVGVVDDENVVRGARDALRGAHEGAVRKLVFTPSSQGRGVEVLDGLASEPLAKQFLDRWAAAEPQSNGAERDTWLRARQLGLVALASHLRKGRR